MKKHNARIAVLDIETAPTKAYIWKRWKENIHLDQVVKEGYVLCTVVKFLDEKSVRIKDLTSSRTWKADKEDDEEVVRFAWDVLNTADIVIAHNAKKFDIAVLNTRFIELGLPPPSPYKIIDTLEVAKNKFRFPYNSLDGIASYLGLGRKIKTDFDLWVRCLAGEMSAWKEMITYCVSDVLLLEKVYLKLIPWIDNHPNMGLYTDYTLPVCPKCASTRLVWQGFARTITQVYRKYQCKDCGGWGRCKKTALTKEESPNIITHAVAS